MITLSEREWTVGEAARLLSWVRGLQSPPDPMRYPTIAAVMRGDGTPTLDALRADALRMARDQPSLASSPP